jgi:uncharacterized protein (TIGR02246 family)
VDTIQSSEQQGHAPEAGAAPRHGWVTTALIALAALLVGLGAGWLVFSPEPPDDVDREIQALIDDYVAAWNVQDGQAVVALMTEDGKHFSGGAGNGKEASSDSPAHSLAYFVEHHVAGATFRSVNDAVIRTDDGPPYLAANVIEIGNGSDGGDSFQSVEVYKIVPEDGVLKIQVHTALIGGLD